MDATREIDPPQREEQPAAVPPNRGRAIGALLCLVFAALLTAPGAVAYWGQRTLNDTQRYVDTVQPLANSPEVQDVLATRVTDALQKQVDVGGIINNVFAGVITDRPRLQQLVGPISAAINGLIERQVREFFASDLFADLWTQVNTRAQQALHRLLEGDQTGAVSVQGDNVVLDVSEVIDQVKQRLVDRGLTFVANAPIPDVDKQIVLLEAPQLRQVRTIYAFSNPVAKWMLPFVGFLYLLAIVLARRKPRMLVAVGACIAVNAVVIALFLAIGRQLFTDQLSGTVFAPAAKVFYETMLAYLQRGQQVVLFLGLFLVVVGWFVGVNRYGSAVRNSITGGLEQTGAALPSEQVGSAGRWVTTNRVWLRIVVVVLGVVVLFWGNDVSVSRWWWSVVLVLVLLALLQILVGAGRPKAPVEASSTEPPAAEVPPRVPTGG